MTPEELTALLDHERFGRMYPDQKNPTDIDTMEKWNFCTVIGFKRYMQMKKTRLQDTVPQHKRRRRKV